MQRWRERARGAKTKIHALLLAYKDPRVPWHARLFAALVVGYALSPLDLIPDPIPVLGYLDDLVLLPIGVVIARRLIPADVLVECREKVAASRGQRKPRNLVAAGVIIMIWFLCAGALAFFLLRAFAD